MNRFWTNLFCACGALSLLGCGDNLEAPQPPRETDADVEVTIKDPIQLTDVTRIPEEDPSFERVEVTAETLVFHYSRKPREPIEVDHVVVGTGESPFMRRIIAVTERTETRVAVSTEAAFITDVIRRGEFELRLAPQPASWRANEDPSVSGHLFAPAAEFSVFNLGTERIGCIPVEGGDPIPVLPILKPRLAQTIKAKIIPSIFPPFGELVSAEFSVEGGVTIGMEVDAKVNAGVQCTIDIIQFLRQGPGNGNRLRFRRPAFVQLGPLPVAMTIILDPVFKIEGTVTAEVEATGTATASLDFEFGTEYLEGEWHTIWSASREATGDVEFGEDSGTITASMKGSAGFQVGALLYDTVGPIIGLVGFLEGKIEVNPYDCRYTNRVDYGTDLIIGLLVQVPLIAKEIAKVQEAFNLNTQPLFEVEERPPLCRHDEPVAAGATYLRTNDDNPTAPSVINLEEVGISPGDTIRLSTKGTYFRASDPPSNQQDAAIGVFSSSSTVLAETEAVRVPGALDAGPDYETDESYQDDGETDIPQDFGIAADALEIEVPAGAGYLIVGINDSYFGDNVPSEEGFFVVVEY